MLTKNNFILAAGLVLIGFGGVGTYAHFSKTEASNSCYANAGEVCPGEDWLAQYKDAKKLGKEVRSLSQSSAMRELQAKTDQLRGMAQRLQAAAPQGLEFDEKSMKFIAQNKPTATPPGPTRTIDAPPGPVPVAQPPLTPPAAVATPPAEATSQKPESKKK